MTAPRRPDARWEYAAAPDEATVRLGINTEAETADEALQQNSQKADAVMKSLTGNGVAEEDIQTTDVRLDKRYQDRGEVRVDDPLRILRLILGTFFSYMLTVVLVAPDHAWDDEAEIEAMVQVLSKGLRP
mgnify:CR=1 FL=1